MKLTDGVTKEEQGYDARPFFKLCFSSLVHSNLLKRLDRQTNHKANKLTLTAS